MTYTLQEQYTSNNFTPAAQVPTVFGMPREVKYITIHHWGNPGQQFDVVREFLCTNTTPTSAHFVAQDGLVACIVNPDDAAWHAGNPQGNAQSIGIECRPEHTDGDYQTIAELIHYLRGIYGDVPLVPHNYWTSTACPGDYDLGRLDTLARGITTQASAVTPLQEDTLSAAEVKQITDHIDAKAKEVTDYVKALAFSGWDDDNGKRHYGFMWVIEENQKRIDAINPYVHSLVSAAVTQILGKTVTVDPATVQAAVAKAVASTPAPAVNPAAIAKAVNDDAAARRLNWK